MVITWLQQKVAPELTGRIMSLVIFAAIGLNAAVLLVCAGMLMTLFTLSAAFSRPVRAGME